MATPDDSMEAKMQDTEALTKVLGEGVRIALERHRRLGERIAIWRNGKAALVTVEEAEAATPSLPPPHP